MMNSSWNPSISLPQPQQQQQQQHQPMEAAPAWANPSQQQPVTNHNIPVEQVAQQHEQELFGAYSTLDEPVRETIMRDVRAVASKLRIVLQPMDRNAILGYAGYAGVSQELASDSDGGGSGSGGGTEAAAALPGQEQSQQPNSTEISENDRRVIQSLKDWDLWGPLMVCLFLAVTLSFKAPQDQASLVFAAVFTAVWVGGCAVTMNAQLLGAGKISFFQSLCVLGYCMFPMALAAVAIGVLKIVPYIKNWIWLDLILVAIGLLWATRASSIFIGMYVKAERRALAVFPVYFFYLFMAWLILLF